MKDMNDFDKLFVGGDLSGIQSFIYNITSCKAAVSLKGRSAWLNLYMTKVCTDLCKVLNDDLAVPVEKIYCSGGKFYLITENNPSVCEAICAFSKTTEEELWKTQCGQVGISIDYVPFAEVENNRIITEDGEGAFSRLFALISQRFAIAKMQKFKSYITTHCEQLFGPYVVNDGGRICAITGIEDQYCQKITDDKDKEDMYVLPSVLDQIRLGEKLRNLDKVTKTFDEFAENSYLGVLRMDVDGLGARFRNVKTKDDYRQFSQRLDKFFLSDIVEENGTYIYKTKSTLYRIWETNYSEDTTIIYAGGDDIFVVGRWNLVLSFAEMIHAKFMENFATDGLTLSGGMAIVDGKFPIAKGAELAGEAEDVAKHFNDGEKNAFCMFGVAVSWKDEFAFVKEYKSRFCHYIDDYEMSHSVLHRIMTLNERRQDLRLDEVASYVWHTVYFLTRLAERYNENSEIKCFCKDLKKDLLKSSRNYTLIALAARWAELELREKQNNNLK